MNEDLRKRLGQKAKELRKTAGLTQNELSDKIGVYRTDLSAFESKGERIGSLEKVNELFESLGYELTVAEKKTASVTA
jgi:transcriptional regulator with XRE-family HTH domain